MKVFLAESQESIKYENVIELQNVDTVYQGESMPALYDISTSFKSGEFIYIVGPNGAGKTTLLETILGLLVIKNGNLTVFGKKQKLIRSEIRKKVGFVPQSFEITPDMPFLVKDIVMIGRGSVIGPGHRPKKADWDKVHSALKMVGMDEYYMTPVGKLSGGMQQKVLIAQALSKDPSVLLLDEPFSNIDIETQQHLMQLFHQLKQTGVTILMVSHILNIPAWCDRVLLIDKGRLIVDQPPELARNHPFIQKYLRLAQISLELTSHSINEDHLIETME